MTSLPRLLPCLLGTLTLASAALPLHALQQRIVDEGSFVILRGGEVVGGEDFQIHRTPGAPEPFTVNGTAYYPADRPTHVLSAVIRLRADSQISSARLELQHDGLRQFALVTVGDRRVTVRMGMPGRESTREYPAGARQVVADDSVFALHALLSHAGPGAVDVLWPRQGRRAAGRLTVHGPEATEVGGVRRTLHHVSIEAGDAVRHLWYDDGGRLQKVTIPALGLTAVRRPAPR